MTTKTITVIAVITVLLIVFATLFLTSCTGERYKVICDGNGFKNVKSSYKVGKQVKIYYPYVATDTDYSFYLDGEKTNYYYDDSKGFVITFTMPSHNVTLSADSKNTMAYVPEADTAGTVLITYIKEISTAIGSDRRTVTVETTEDASEHLMTVTTSDGNVTVYAIPSSAYTYCCDRINCNKLWKWNELKEYECLSGKLTSFSCLMDGEYITVSTNQMPKDGEKVLGELYSELSVYMTEQYERK